MGGGMSMNPFTEDGRENIRTYTAANRGTVTAILVIAILLVLGLMYVVYTYGVGSVEKPKLFEFPPPRAGEGPYGYGMYAPPQEMVAGMANTM